jgi:MFS family permease
MSQTGQNFRLVFGLALIPGCLAVCLLALGIREPKPSVHQSKANLFRDGWQSLGKEYWLLVAVALLFNLGNSSDAFLLLQAQQAGVATPLIPLTLVIMNLAYSLTAYPVGGLSDRIGRFGLFVSSLLLYALVYLGFAFAHAAWQIWGLFALYGLYLGLSQGVLLALVADKVPVNLRGTAFGMINLASGIALLPASLLAGFLWQSIGSEATFMSGSFFAITATVVLLFAARSH